MREPLLAHQVVRLKGGIEIVEVNPDRAAHEHVLGSLYDIAVALEKIGALESFEAEEVVVEIATVVNDGVNFVYVVSDHVVDLFGEKRSVSALLVLISIQQGGCFEHARGGTVAESLHSNSIGKHRVVRVNNCHVGASFGGQICDFSGCDTYI